MAVPGTRVELQIAGTWTDVTAAVRKGTSLSHTRGRRSEGARVDPSSTSLTLSDPAGSYNDRNPRSPYFGQLPRGTPVRYSVDGAAVGLVLLSGVTSRAVTPDVAALDITGDIDVRADLTPSYWKGSRGVFGWEVMGKHGVASSMSWRLYLNDSGTLSFYWSEVGSDSGFLESNASVPFGPGQRGAIRVTLDVNNGSSGHTVTFYTSDTISGSWTQLGTPVVEAGVTSIFAGTSELRVGDFTTSTTEGTARIVNAIEVRNGIGGSVVANPVFSAQASGTTSFTDGAGRTWSLAGAAAITSRRQRAIGEVSEWAPRWHVSGNNVVAPITAAGVMRRLGQGRRPLKSVLTRSTPGTLPVAYWPLEDGADSTQAYSPLPGVAPLQVSGLSMAADSSLPASDALPTLVGGASMSAVLPVFSPTGIWQIDFRYKVGSAPSGAGTILEWTTTGSPWRIWRLRFTATGYDLIVEDGAGATTVVDSVNISANWGQGWFKFTVLALETGSDLFVITSGGSGLLTNTTAGRIVGFSTVFGASLAGTGFGHLAVYDKSSASPPDTETAQTGETAGTRVVRLATEQVVPVDTVGDPATQQAMGYQRPAQLLELLAECEAADGGVLCEDRDRLGLIYQSRESLYNRTPVLTIPYGHLPELGPPQDDDTRIRNDRTVNRANGSFGRWALTTGAMSTLDAPNGVGPYEDEVTLSLATDEQCQPIAQWLVHMGTINEARYPQVKLLLHKYPQYIDAVTRLDVGSVVRVTDLPAHLPPGPLDLLVEGYEEVLGPLSWELTLTCSPASAWRVAIADDLVYGRADTDGSVLGAAATPSATTLVVHTVQTSASAPPAWAPGTYPVDLRLGGEVVTASAVAPLAADTFTRSVAAGGWGTASDGHPYTLVGGSSSDRSVSATYGVVTLASSPATLRHQVVTETCQGCDVRAAVAVSATATGNSLTAGIVTRYVDSSNFYRVRVEFTTGGGISLTVTRNITVIGSGSVATGVSYTPGSVIEVRVRLIGHRMLARVWPTGQGEPSTWNVDETVSASVITDGYVGLAASGISGNTNVSPEIRFHDWVVETPQRVTVARGTNGITKSHVAGTDIRLAQSAIAAL